MTTLYKRLYKLNNKDPIYKIIIRSKLKKTVRRPQLEPEPEGHEDMTIYWDIEDVEGDIDDDNEQISDRRQ